MGMRELIIKVDDPGERAWDGSSKVFETKELVRCKDCDNKECWGRAGDVVCGIDGTPHRPDWYCADGERS